MKIARPFASLHFLRTVETRYFPVFLFGFLLAQSFPALSQQSCPVAPVKGGECWTTEDVLQSEIDHHAQSAMLRMFASGGTAANEASQILCAVRSRQLEGVYLPDQGVPALRAQAAGSGWWLIIPQGKLSTCYKEPADRAPLIAFRKQIKDNKDFLAGALSSAWNECGIPASAPRCYTATISKPTVAQGECSNDLDCKDDEQPYCHPDTGRCVQCLVDAHCNELDHCSLIDNFCHVGGPGEKPLPCQPDQCYLALESTCPHPRVCVPIKGPNPNQCGTCVTPNAQQRACHERYEKEWKSAVEECNTQKNFDDLKCLAKVEECKKGILACGKGGFEIGKCGADARKKQLDCFKGKPAEAKRKQAQCVSN